MQGAASAETREAGVDGVGEVGVGEVIEEFFWKVLGARVGGGLVFCFCEWRKGDGRIGDMIGMESFKKKKKNQFLPKTISCGHRVQLSF